MSFQNFSMKRYSIQMAFISLEFQGVPLCNLHNMSAVSSEKFGMNRFSMQMCLWLFYILIFYPNGSHNKNSGNIVRFKFKSWSFGLQCLLKTRRKPGETLPPCCCMGQHAGSRKMSSSLSQSSRFLHSYWKKLWHDFFLKLQLLELFVIEAIM